MIIKHGLVVDPASSLSEHMDILVKNGKIARIAPEISEDSEEILEAGGLVVGPGLIDTHVHFRDPGFTYKEDIHTGAKASAKGGFTTVICMANTSPTVDNTDTLKDNLARASKEDIRIFQAAAISRSLKGRDEVDMLALKEAGACGFTDDGIQLKDTALVKKAMEESVRLNVPLSFHEEDPALITNNGINRGAVSEHFGIGGSPAAAEDVLVARDCMLALHTGALIDIQHISSGHSVRMVELAKQLGAHVMAEVTPHHFSLDESAVLKHGTLAKMNPPLRTREDKQEILRGLKEGVIDIIATDHAPHSAEEKAKPLTEAPSGIIGLETALALGVTNLVREDVLTMPQLMEKMSLNPAILYHLEGNKGHLSTGADADLVLFDPNEKWTVKEFKSKATNSPFIGEELYGKVKYTICGGKIAYVAIPLRNN